ncbi:16S rRNA (guanine(527)-N(7))-methyltransferase RsmG [Paenibacillus thalictri]|uniref:Ribosomal RNA small subunit methyltransferase G n=1 Tax=Paenibacillus thalictri TaxID=2527873 RepID=A0A4Q9DRC3_9BACL|nr:16S rRNA (guanine(527)-N(7))-methyltransferase RsmG [Paenibacillus thalictri]TBL77464.1 16S rRNA (guanine(527)-N(7))-methyltransferase RsmG [Paenibacillus thalictri]
MDAVQNRFVSLLEQNNITLTPQQLQQFETYFKELVLWNEKMNLTGITEREQVYVKHFYDSLSVSFFVSMKNIKRVADIGSGAGFPSIPLKIVFPHLQVTIIDSLNKRIQFLNHLCAELQLNDMLCLHSRAEDAARLPQHRDQYDLVTARAVARLSVLNEFCLPFVTKGGLFAAMKGSAFEEELTEAAFSFNELKSKPLQVHKFVLPDEEHSTRHILVAEKQAVTPKKYPRKAGVPLKNPLIG